MKKSKTPQTVITPLEGKTKLVKKLAKQDLTIAQAKQKLTDWGLERNEIQELIDECVQKNWLNDFRYALRFTESKMAKGYGWKRIRWELEARGIPEDVCKSVFQEMYSVEIGVEEESLRKVAEKEWQKLSALSDEKRVSRFVNRLLRRGFLHHQIMNILRSLEQREKRNYVGRNKQEEG